MEINVSNLPFDKVYQFDTNKYIRTVIIGGERDGFVARKVITDVFELNNDGNKHFLASGKVVKNEYNDYSKGFIIKDIDNDEMIAFRIMMPLREVSYEELGAIKEEINQNKSK